MPKIENREVLRRIERDAGIQPLRDGEPVQLAQNVQPVLISNPELVSTFIKSANRSTTGATTLYTAPNNKRTFITAAILTGTADAAADAVAFTMSVTAVDGTAQTLIYLAKTTLTAWADSISISFPFPIEVKALSSIIISTAFTVGTAKITGSIVGYDIDTT